MDDAALVVNTAQEALAALQTIHDIGSVLGFMINARKTKVHHWRTQPSMESIDFHGVTHLVLPAVAQYLGHMLAHKSPRLSVEQDILQTVAANLKSYKNLPLTAWERAELVSTTLLPRWCCRGGHVGGGSSAPGAHRASFFLPFPTCAHCCPHLTKQFGVPSRRV